MRESRSWQQKLVTHPYTADLMLLLMLLSGAMALQLAEISFLPAASEILGPLVQSAAIGWLLILMVLYLFLGPQIAFRVAPGVLCAFTVVPGVLWMAGQSLNIVLLAAMLVTLAIVLDHAVVVGEAVFSRLVGGSPGQAVFRSSKKMFRPLLFSSLSMLATLLLPMLLTGSTGNTLISVPLVIFSMLLASMLYCFAVLPGHLYHSLNPSRERRAAWFRLPFQAGAERVKASCLLPLVRLALRHPWLSLMTAVLFFFASVYLLRSERVGVNLSVPAGAGLFSLSGSVELSGVVLLVLVMIYSLLVIFLRSWRWPVPIMLAIPPAIGAVVIGHWLCDIEMSMLSLFSFAGVTAVLVSGVIILIAQYRQYRELKARPFWAMQLACEKRMRPVMITTLTMTVGLLPLLLPVNEQVAVFKPVAVTVVAGLLSGSLLVLILIPALVVALDSCSTE